MVTRKKVSPDHKLGPHSKVFARGALGDNLDGRSKEGRFVRNVEADLIAHLGGTVSPVAQILIRRAAKVLLQLELLDTKMASGDWSEHDGRMYSALSNNLRLTLREIGIKGPTPGAPTIADLAARYAR